MVADRTDDGQSDCALMASVREQLAEVADAVAAVRSLAGLPDPERRECAKTSAVKRYAARSVVYGTSDIVIVKLEISVVVFFSDFALFAGLNQLLSYFSTINRARS